MILGLSQLDIQAPQITAPNGKLTPSVQALKFDMSSPSRIETVNDCENVVPPQVLPVST